MIDKETIYLAEAAGIDLGKAYIRQPDNRFFVWHADAFPGNTGAPRLALRSRVVWWLHTGEALRGQEHVIHHKNDIKTDDRICNLEKISQSEHSRHHNEEAGSWVDRICASCLRSFQIERWRLKDRSRGKYCSQPCYQRRRAA